MGSPDKLTAAQLAKLQSLTRDLPEKNQLVRVGANGSYSVTIPMRSNDVVLVTLDHR
jgi:xylan 1,4-beta-xylosidase